MSTLTQYFIITVRAAFSNSAPLPITPPSRLWSTSICTIPYPVFTLNILDSRNKYVPNKLLIYSQSEIEPYLANSRPFEPNHNLRLSNRARTGHETKPIRLKWTVLELQSAELQLVNFSIPTPRKFADTDFRLKCISPKLVGVYRRLLSKSWYFGVFGAIFIYLFPTA